MCQRQSINIQKKDWVKKGRLTIQVVRSVLLVCGSGAPCPEAPTASHPARSFSCASLDSFLLITPYEHQPPQHLCADCTMTQIVHSHPKPSRCGGGPCGCGGPGRGESLLLPVDLVLPWRCRQPLTRVPCASNTLLPLQGPIRSSRSPRNPVR